MTYLTFQCVTSEMVWRILKLSQQTSTTSAISMIVLLETHQKFQCHFLEKLRVSPKLKWGIIR